MRKVTKVLMYVWRKRNEGKEFFVLHRKKGDNVVLTGHVEPNESLKQTVKREIKEELGVEPITIVNLGVSISVEIKEDDVLSTEHAFLIEIPSDKEVYFLEEDEKHNWHPLEELSKVLTYSNQRKPIAKIKEVLNKTSFCI